jgi:hypothetical protein
MLSHAVAIPSGLLAPSLTLRPLGAVVDGLAHGMIEVGPDGFEVALHILEGGEGWDGGKGQLCVSLTYEISTTYDAMSQGGLARGTGVGGTFADR